MPDIFRRFIKISTVLLLLLVPSNALAAEGDILFSDDFNDGILDGWSIERGNWSVDNGNLLTTESGSFNFQGTAYPSPAEWDNYRIDLDLNTEQGVDVGLIFRKSEGSSYGFNLRHGRSYGAPEIKLFKEENYVARHIGSIYPDELLNNVWYHIKIEVVDENLKLWVNNNLVYDFTDPGTSIKKGGIALQSWTGSNGYIQIRFDNIKVTSLGSATSPKTPVIFIPGIGGSELKVTQDTIWSKDDGHRGIYNHAYTAGEKVWINEGEALSLGSDDYFDILRLKQDGSTGETNLELTGNIYSGAYGNTIKFFTDNGYTINQDLFVFPYDWRKDIASIAPLLDQKIADIKTQTGSPKVDIVAHSMGGLIARNYINDPAKAQNVRKLITLGTPHLGAVKFLEALKSGTCLLFEVGPLCFSINPTEVKDVIQNMISGYELSPSQKYYDFYDGSDNNHPIPFIDNRDIDNNGVTGFLTYQQLKTTLANLGHNTPLFIPAETFHNQDNNFNNLNGVDVSIIAGSGKATTGQIIEDYHLNFAGVKIPKTDIRKVNGDDTVPLFSASLTDGSKTIAGLAKIYYTNQQHGGLVFDGSAMNLVKNILSDIPFSAKDYEQPSRFSGTGLSSHSPVLIHAYDQNGKHTGPLLNGDYETQIPGSSYEVLGDAKFIWLPDNGVYTVKFEATDQGSFDFKIRDYKDDINDKTILYKNIPLTISTKAETIFDTNSSSPSILKIDPDGNGTSDSEINPSTTLIGEANFDNTAPTVSLNFPLNDSILVLNQTVKADFQCNDENSDIDKCQGTISAGENIDTSSVGTKEFKVFAEDKAGNTSLQTITYKVQYSNNICLNSPGHTVLQPINIDGSSTFKQGSTVPVKFRVCDNNGISIGTSSIVNSFNLVRTVYGTTVNNINEPVDSTTPESNFRWDTTKQQWIFNMSTKVLSAGKTYFYKVSLNDGTNIEFNFGLK